MKLKWSIFRRFLSTEGHFSASTAPCSAIKSGRHFICCTYMKGSNRNIHMAPFLLGVPSKQGDGPMGWKFRSSQDTLDSLIRKTSSDSQKLISLIAQSYLITVCSHGIFVPNETFLTVRQTWLQHLCNFLANKTGFSATADGNKTKIEYIHSHKCSLEMNLPGTQMF